VSDSEWVLGTREWVKFERQQKPTISTEKWRGRRWLIVNRKLKKFWTF